MTLLARSHIDTNVLDAEPSAGSRAAPWFEYLISGQAAVMASIQSCCNRDILRLARASRRPEFPGVIGANAVFDLWPAF